MAIDLRKKYYLRPGIKKYRENDNVLHLASPYDSEKYWLDYKKEIIDLIANLAKDKSLAEVLESTGIEPAIIEEADFQQAWEFLISKDLVAFKPYEGLLTEDEVAMYYANIFYLNHSFQADGLKLQADLKTKKICLLGLGGTGTSLILSLAGLGIGTIKLIDKDVLAADNLPRQMLYKYKDIGQQKVHLMVDYIKGLNPFIEVEAHELSLAAENLDAVKEVFKGCDLIVVAADEPDYLVVLKYVQEICFELDLPFIGGAAADGFIPPLFIPGKTACLDCLFKLLPDADLLRDKNNHPQLKLGRFMSSHMSVPYFKLLEGNALVAREIIKFLLRQESDLINHYYTGISTERKNIPREKDCVCQNIKSISHYE